jgi:YHS domain-containing protein
MLIRFIIFSVLIYFLYRIIKYFSRAKSVGMNTGQVKVTPSTREDLVEDPACHTYIPVSQSYKKEIAGKNYYFCSKECYESYVLEKNNERQ